MAAGARWAISIPTPVRIGRAWTPFRTIQCREIPQGSRICIDRAGFD